MKFPLIYLWKKRIPQKCWSASPIFVHLVFLFKITEEENLKDFKDVFSVLNLFESTQNIAVKKQTLELIKLFCNIGMKFFHSIKGYTTLCYIKRILSKKSLIYFLETPKSTSHLVLKLFLYP